MWCCYHKAHAAGHDADLGVVSLSTIEHHHRPDGLADFRVKTTLWIAITGGVFLAPFAVSNMLRGELLLGGGALGVVAILGVLALMSYRGRRSRFSLVLFPPVLAFLLMSIDQQGVIGVMWAYPGIVIFYFIFQERWAWVANTIIVATVIPAATTTLEPSIALRAAVTLIVVSAFSIMTIRVIASQQARLEEMAITDSLTGLLNRSLLIPSLEQALDRHGRAGEPATLLTIDLDHFKKVNDTFGHVVGDNVLTAVANVLRTRLQPDDLVFRTGGEEFSILLPDTDGEPGHHVAQVLRSEVAGQSLLADHPVTISIGATRLRGDDNPGSWFARADHCLYQAKNGGRNRVVTDVKIACGDDESKASSTTPETDSPPSSFSPPLQWRGGLRALPPG